MAGVSNIAAEWEAGNPVFQPWPKISRQPVWMRVTEKLDGTNACVIVAGDGSVHAQSRKRIITPESDNFGFAAWVQENAAELAELGTGYHYGEWFGKGIQRGYGLEERRFALFGHWYRGFAPFERVGPGSDVPSPPALPPCVRLVPEIYRGEVDAVELDDAVTDMRSGSWVGHWDGSRWVTFRDSEGVVVEYISGRSIIRQKIVISEWRGGKEATRG